MAENRFRKCAQAIDEKALKALAGLWGNPLPDAFCAHYLAQNGGVPERPWWDSLDEFAPCMVHEFCSVRHGKKTMEALFARLRDRKEIPDGLLPFALGGSGQYFCLEAKTGAVVLLTVEPALAGDSAEEPAPRKPPRKLSRDFKEFVKGLVSEGELD